MICTLVCCAVRKGVWFCTTEDGSGTIVAVSCILIQSTSHFVALFPQNPGPGVEPWAEPDVLAIPQQIAAGHIGAPPDPGLGAPLRSPEPTPLTARASHCKRCR